MKVSPALAKTGTMIFLPAALLILCIHIEGYFFAYNLKKGIKEKDVLFRALGEFRQTISAMVWMKADEYYHGGIPGPKEEKHLEERKETAAAEHVHEQESLGIRFAWQDYIAFINRHIQISAHKHLRDSEEKELTPWFYLATKLDPHNVPAYIVGAYWVGERMEKPDEGLIFLEEGRANNPDDWRIYEEFGNIYYLIKKDFARAADYYQYAFNLMDDKNSTLIDRKRMLTFLGANFEKSNNFLQAIKYFQELLKLSGPDEVIEKRIEQMEQGKN